MAAGYAAWTLKPEPSRQVARFTVSLPEGQQFTNTGRSLVALSPDGANLVYVANQRLNVRSLSGLESRVISGSESSAGVLNPVFSPDGQSLVFHSPADLTLKRIPLSGGAPVTICPVDNLYGLSWSEHGIVFGQRVKGVMRVSPNGGVPEVIGAVDGEEVVSSPQLLPGGRAVLFSVKKVTARWDKAQIVVQPLNGGARKTIIEGGSEAKYLPTGHLVYAVSGMLLAIPFDLGSLTTTGGPVPVVEGVRRAGARGTSPATAQFSFSMSGSVAYLPGPVTNLENDGLDLAIFDRQGTPQPLKLPLGSYHSPRVSPDGKSVVFDSEDESGAVVLTYELAGTSAIRRLTFGGKSRAPIWSADGQWIAFQSDREGDLAIFWQRADGTGTAERLTKPEKGTAHLPQSWSPDGQHLLFTAQTGDAQFSLWTMAMKDRRTAAFGNVQSAVVPEAEFSPDGRWVVYFSRDSGAGSAGNQVFVQPFPSTGAKYLVPQPGGAPYWSAKGDAIILNSSPSQSSSVAFTATPRVGFGRPVEFPRLGRIEGNPSTTRRNTDSLPDGDRVIGVLPPGASQAATRLGQINVVINWFDEIRARVPKP